MQPVGWERGHEPTRSLRSLAEARSPFPRGIGAPQDGSPGAGCLHADLSQARRPAPDALALRSRTHVNRCPARARHTAAVTSRCGGRADNSHTLHPISALSAASGSLA